MAQAGFIFHPLSDSRDNVLCPYCRISLDNWGPTDDPIAEHRKTRVECVHLHYMTAEVSCQSSKRSRTQKLRPTKRITPSSGVTTTPSGMAPSEAVAQPPSPPVTVESFLKDEIYRMKKMFLVQRIRTWRSMERRFLDSLRLIRNSASDEQNPRGSGR